MRRFIALVLVAGFAAAFVAAQSGENQESREQRNKELIRKFYDEVWQKGNLDFADQVFAENYVRNDPRGGAPPAPGPKGQKIIAEGFRKQFPDLQYKVDFLLADGDYVVGRWTITGTNTGAGPRGEPATGKRVEFVGVNIFRFKPEGKVVEIWNHRDDLTYATQIGVVVPAER